MAYADLAAAEAAFDTLQTAVAAIQTARTGTAVSQRYNLGGPEQKLLSMDEIDEAVDAVEVLLAAYKAGFD
jgi:hypothetical protein